MCCRSADLLLHFLAKDNYQREAFGCVDCCLGVDCGGWRCLGMGADVGETAPRITSQVLAFTCDMHGFDPAGFSADPACQLFRHSHCATTLSRDWHARPCPAQSDSDRLSKELAISAQPFNAPRSVLDFALRAQVAGCISSMPEHVQAFSATSDPRCV